jgi:hypothetical protein
MLSRAAACSRGSHTHASHGDALEPPSPAPPALSPSSAPPPPPPPERRTRRVQLVREEGTRRVQSVREGGGGARLLSGPPRGSGARARRRSLPPRGRVSARGAQCVRLVRGVERCASGLFAAGERCASGLYGLGRDVRPVCTGWGEMCVRFVRAGAGTIKRGRVARDGRAARPQQVREALQLRTARKERGAKNADQRPPPLPQRARGGCGPSAGRGRCWSHCTCATPMAQSRFESLVPRRAFQLAQSKKGGAGRQRPQQRRGARAPPARRYRRGTGRGKGAEGGGWRL